MGRILSDYKGNGTKANLAEVGVLFKKAVRYSEQR